MKHCWALMNKNFVMFFPLSTNRNVMREARKSDPDMRFARIEGIIQVEEKFINGQKYKREK